MTVFERLFDEAFYLQSYPDVAAAVAAGQIPSGLAHFLGSGLQEGRTLISRFYRRGDGEARYLAANPDVAAVVASGGLASGLQHFLGVGESEGRSLFPGAFDEQWYRDRYPDIREAIAQGVFTSGLEHYLAFGRDEVRSVSPLFELGYFTINGDVRDFRDNGGSFLSAADHFAVSGQQGGRPATFSGTRGNDTVVGTAAIDTLSGVEVDAGTCFSGGSVTGGQCREYDSIGVNEQDVLIGGTGADSFELGYLRSGRLGEVNVLFYVGNGDEDFARIQNFDTAMDRLLLPPNTGAVPPAFLPPGVEPQPLYTLEARPGGVHVTSGSGDLVAILEGVSNPNDILIGRAFSTETMM
ncbi:MAG: hypothetical protein AAF685_07245 [Cyanobacteria bacterium P01_C01_bin.89]